MVCAFFTDTPVINYETAKTSDMQQFNKVFGSLLDHGVSIAPSQFEGMFVSLAHSDEDIDETIHAYREALKTL
jgi:glutamate-1-semialdehyde 2,1-aminomutase